MRVAESANAETPGHKDEDKDPQRPWFETSKQMEDFNTRYAQWLGKYILWGLGMIVIILFALIIAEVVKS